MLGVEVSYDQKGFVSRCGEDMARLNFLLVEEFSSPANRSAPKQQPIDEPERGTPLRPVLLAFLDLNRHRYRIRDDDNHWRKLRPFRLIISI